MNHNIEPHGEKLTDFEYHNPIYLSFSLGIYTEILQVGGDVYLCTVLLYKTDVNITIHNKLVAS